jgi:hypothetical protein
VLVRELCSDHGARVRGGDSGKPLYDELRNGLLEADFPYERYLRDTVLLAQFLEPS